MGNEYIVSTPWGSVPITLWFRWSLYDWRRHKREVKRWQRTYRSNRFEGIS